MAGRAPGRDHVLTRGASIALCAAIAIAACGDDRLAPGEAARLVEPHRQRFAEFDRWARRAIGAEVELSRGALEETIFAPIRDDDAIVGAWVATPDGDREPLSLAGDEKPPSGTTWIDLRDPELGPVRVAVAKVTDARGSGQDRPAIPCVLVSRDRRVARGDVVVTVAFDIAADVKDEPESER